MEIAKHKEQGGRRERESVHTVWSKKKKERGGLTTAASAYIPKPICLSYVSSLSTLLFLNCFPSGYAARFVFPRTIGRRKLKNWERAQTSLLRWVIPV